MPRPLWTGSIGFGLVNVPIRLYPAVHQKDVQFHLLSPDGRCRLRRKLYCPETGREFQFNQTVRGYEISPDQYVIITDEELKNLKPKAGRTIEITDFVNQDEIDPVYYNRPYYVGPGKEGSKAYKLLVQALKESKKVGIAKFVMRDKEYLAAVRPIDGALCLETMNFHDEVDEISEIPDYPVEGKVQKKELEVARKLIDALASDFKPEKYREEYRQRVLELVEQKADGKEVIFPEAAEEPPRVFNLMKALEESLADARKTRRRRKSA